jgi:hypothetical protein
MDAPAGRDRLRRRARRFHRLALALGAGAIACASAGGYFAVTVVQLRGVERTWRGALAVDAARARADGDVTEAMARVGDPNDDAATDALTIIGDDAARRLLAAERALDDRAIFDSKVSTVRDAMVEAVRFRRFQMTPQRRQIGDTPIAKAEAELGVQLDRWGLDRSEAAVPTLRSVAVALTRLRRFADVPTGTTLFAVRNGTELLTIDVDADTVASRTVPRPVVALVPVPGGVGVFDGGELAIYPPDPQAPVVVRAPAARGAVPAADGTGDVWLVDADGGVRRFRPAAGEQPQSPAALPPGSSLVGAAKGWLVLADADDGHLVLWSPTTGTTRDLSGAGARFLAALDDEVLWQGPLPFGDRSSDGFLHGLDLPTGDRDLLALPPTDAASAAIAPDGSLAVAAGPLAGRLGSVLVVAPHQVALLGAAGPRVSVEAQSLAWSSDGRWLFWRTPDGQIALRGRALDARGRLLRTGLGSLERLVALPR